MPISERSEYFPHPPIILDIEASGFGSRSYPIELGVIDSLGEKYCALVTPFNDWDHWSDEAEGIHKISPRLLIKHGQDGMKVCRQLNEILRGKTVYSDGWVVDQPWLSKLFFRAGVRLDFHLSPIENILSEKQMLVWDQTKLSVISEFGLERHRASIDAHIIQTTYMRTLQQTQFN